MPISDYVDMTISRNSVGIQRAGFGIALILSANAAFGPRIKFYADSAEVLTDGFAVTSPEYLAASSFFADPNYAPKKIAIGRCVNKPTQKYIIDADAAQNSHLYSIEVDGDGVTSTDAEYTSDASATLAEIHNGLMTALNSVVGKNYTVSFATLTVADFTFTAAADDILTAVANGLQTGDGPLRVTTSAADQPLNLLLATDYWWIRLSDDTGKLATSLALALAGTAVDIADAGTGVHTIDITASSFSPSNGLVALGDAAGEWFSLAVEEADLVCYQSHADPGVATDLAAIRVVDQSWYAVYSFYNSSAYVEAIGDYTETNELIYLPDSNSTLAVTASEGGGGQDILDLAKTQDWNGVMAMYHDKPAEMAGARWLGRILPLDPGSYTFSLKSLTGLPTVDLTTTYRTNITDKNGNSYEDVAGEGVTFNGTTGDGEFLDTRIGLAWLKDDMTKAVLAVQLANDKLPYDQSGIDAVVGAVRSSLKRAVKRKVLAEFPEPTVTAPKIGDIDEADITARLLPDIKFSGRIAGAVHKVNLRGTVSGA